MAEILTDWHDEPRDGDEEDDDLQYLNELDSLEERAYLENLKRRALADDQVYDVNPDDYPYGWED